MKFVGSLGAFDRRGTVVRSDGHGSRYVLTKSSQQRDRSSNERSIDTNGPSRNSNKPKWDLASRLARIQRGSICFSGQRTAGVIADSIA